jgi:hypothetical protein
MTGHHLVSDNGYPPLGAIITATLIPITHGESAHRLDRGPRWR